MKMSPVLNAYDMMAVHPYFSNSVGRFRLSRCKRNFLFPDGFPIFNFAHLFWHGFWVRDIVAKCRAG